MQPSLRQCLLQTRSCRVFFANRPQYTTLTCNLHLFVGVEGNLCECFRSWASRDSLRGLRPVVDPSWARDQEIAGWQTWWLQPDSTHVAMPWLVDVITSKRFAQRPPTDFIPRPTSCCDPRTAVADKCTTMPKSNRRTRANNAALNKNLEPKWLELEPKWLRTLEGEARMQVQNRWEKGSPTEEKSSSEERCRGVPEEPGKNDEQVAVRHADASDGYIIENQHRERKNERHPS